MDAQTVGEAVLQVTEKLKWMIVDAFSRSRF